MGGASSYMVQILHKHHQQVLHLQNAKILYTAPPEIKAAQSILLLMLCFLVFYWVDCLLSLFIIPLSDSVHCHKCSRISHHWLHSS